MDAFSLRPPTDNLYKFAAIFGLVLVVFGGYLVTQVKSRSEELNPLLAGVDYENFDAAFAADEVFVGAHAALVTNLQRMVTQDFSDAGFSVDLELRDHLSTGGYAYRPSKGGPDKYVLSWSTEHESTKDRYDYDGHDLIRDILTLKGDLQEIRSRYIRSDEAEELGDATLDAIDRTAASLRFTQLAAERFLGHRVFFRLLRGSTDEQEASRKRRILISRMSVFSLAIGSTLAVCGFVAWYLVVQRREDLLIATQVKKLKLEIDAEIRNKYAIAK